MTKQIMVSLVQIKSYYPCVGGWRAVLSGQRKVAADDKLFPLVDCLESNTTTDVLWFFGKLSNLSYCPILVTAARKFAESVKHLQEVSLFATDAARFATDAARYAIEAARYATDAARFATEAARFAADAVAAAADAAGAGAVAADAVADAAYKEQLKLNKQILRDCILSYEAGTL